MPRDENGVLRPYHYSEIAHIQDSASRRGTALNEWRNSRGERMYGTTGWLRVKEKYARKTETRAAKREEGRKESTTQDKECQKKTV